MADTNVKDLSTSPYGKTRLANWGVADTQLSNARAWVVFAALFIFATCCQYQNVMVAPVLTAVSSDLGMDISGGGFIQSVYAIAGIILSFPAAWIMRNLGIKFSLLVTGIISIIGNVLALVATVGSVFLVARILQGCGYGLIAVIGPNLMPRLFPLKKQGLVMGVWSQWVCPGIALSALTTPLIFQSFGWRPLFYLSTFLQVASTILVLAAVKMPAIPENMLVESDATRKREYKHVYTASAFVVGFTFIAWCASYHCFNSFYPTYAQDIQQMPLMLASLTTLVCTLVTIPFGIGFGILADRIRQRKVLLIAGYVIMAILYGTLLWSENYNPALSWVSVVLLGGICAGLIPTTTRSIIPVLAQEPRKTDYALTTMAFVTQVGNFLSVFFSIILTTHTFHFAALAFPVPLCIAAIVVLLFVKNDHNVEVDG